MQNGEFVEQIPTPKLPSFFNGQKVRKLERLDDDLFRKLINSILTSSGINASYGTSLPLDGFQAEVGRTNMRQHLLVTLVVVIQLLLIVRWR